jgi:hypothetical protein
MRPQETSLGEALCSAGAGAWVDVLAANRTAAESLLARQERWGRCDLGGKGSGGRLARGCEHSYSGGGSSTDERP